MTLPFQKSNKFSQKPGARAVCPGAPSQPSRVVRALPALVLVFGRRRCLGHRQVGATAGDDIYVSGTLGDAALALAVLQGRATLGPADLAQARRHLETPEPRVTLGELLRGVATAAIDISGTLAWAQGQSG